MNAVQQINRYIKRTKGMDDPNYELPTGALAELCSIAKKDRAESVILAYRYGRARGLRAANAKQKKEIIL